MTALKRFLSNDIAQRFLYFIGVILWTVLWLQEDTIDNPNRAYDITWWIPVFLFILQIFFNHRVIWRLIVITLTIYFAFMFLLMLSGLASAHNPTLAAQCLSIAFLWLSACWVAYQLKPVKVK
ncbi:MAG: hypothetical protein ACXVPQ_12350 [Bacteroidia bacterium]